MKKCFVFVLALTVVNMFGIQVFAQEEKPLSGQVSDRFTEAQEILLQARGSYKTIKMQEEAIENMRKATNLSLKAARLRTKAERLQHKADVLVNKANLAALSRGLYITNPLAPVKMDPPPVAIEPATTPVSPPVPGKPINISIPKEQERVVYKQEANGDDMLPEPPATNDF